MDGIAAGGQAPGEKGLREGRVKDEGTVGAFNGFWKSEKSRERVGFGGPSQSVAWVLSDLGLRLGHCSKKPPLLQVGPGGVRSQRLQGPHEAGEKQ